MSAGAFVRTRYAAAYNGTTTQIHPIRVQQETIDCVIDGTANDPPAGAINNPITAVISKGRRARGLIVRTVTLEAPTTGQPTGYKPGGLTTIPCLNGTFFAKAVSADDDTIVTYNGNGGYKVAYTSDELVR